MPERPSRALILDVERRSPKVGDGGGPKAPQLANKDVNLTSVALRLVGETPEVQVVVSHLPAGQGYQLQVSALASDGVTECDGTTTFDVVDSSARLTLTVHLECAVPTGDVSVAATVNLCPVVDGLSASPLTVTLGGVSTLQIEAHDSDNRPAPLSYRWRVNGFTLPGQTAPTLSFFCSSPGNLAITGTVSDGDPNPSCASSATATVSCQ